MSSPCQLALFAMQITALPGCFCPIQPTKKPFLLSDKTLQAGQRHAVKNLNQSQEKSALW